MLTLLLLAAETVKVRSRYWCRYAAAGAGVLVLSHYGQAIRTSQKRSVTSVQQQQCSCIIEGVALLQQLLLFAYSNHAKRFNNLVSKVIMFRVIIIARCWLCLFDDSLVFPLWSSSMENGASIHQDGE